MTRSRTSGPRLALLFVLGVALSSGAQAASPNGRAPVGSGERVYEYWCAPCHAPGPGHPGTQSLQVKYGGKTPAVLLERTDLTPQSVAFFVRHGVLSMPPFRKTEITDAQLAALADYVARGSRAP
ncbi:MAG: cytochrome c [Steroidobacteraceae bacterium]